MCFTVIDDTPLTQWGVSDMMGASWGASNMMGGIMGGVPIN